MAACFSCVGAFAPSIDFLANSTEIGTSVARAVCAAFPLYLDRQTANASTFYYPSSNVTFGTKDSILSLAYSERIIKYTDESRKLKKFGKIDSKYIQSIHLSSKRFLDCHIILYLYFAFSYFSSSKLGSEFAQSKSNCLTNRANGMSSLATLHKSA